VSWLTDTFIATAALIAAVLVLRRPVGRWFGPGMAYALWALPLLRLMLPPLLMPAEAPASADAVTYQLVAVDGAGAVAPSPAAVWSDLAPILQAAWLAGALAFAFWRVWSYRAMRRALLADARALGEAGKVRLVETPHASAPVAFGLFDKVVALPPGFMEQPDRTARDLAIAHELEHHAGRDLAVNIAMQPLLALHWFNPLAWAGWRALRRDQEAACDARVLAGRCSAERAAYGRLIASFAQGPRLALAAPMACPVLGEKSIIHRLRSLTMSQPSPRRTAAGRLLIGAAALALPLTASITYAASEAPQAPEAPEAPEPPAAPEAPEAHVEKHVIVIQRDEKKHGDAASSGEGPRKVVIIDRDGSSEIDDSALNTRTVVRDGRTYVFKTSKPMSQEEAEAKVADMAKGMPITAEAFVFAPGAKSGQPVVHTMTISSDEAAVATATAGHACSGEWTEARAESDKDGKHQVTRMKICADGKHAKGDALKGLRTARERIAADTKMDAEIRRSILEQLDAEIAKLSNQN
jgi:beta-lactamase regulating signal transducer with metallopeptidase domain